MAHNHPIRKKLKGFHPCGDPLPIPIASQTGVPSLAASWSYYKGIYRNGLVTVTNINHISSLWHNGYFGQLKKTSSHVGKEKGNSCTSKKRWKLLECDGLEDMLCFNKFGETDDVSKDGELLKSEGEDYHEKQDTDRSKEKHSPIDVEKICTDKERHTLDSDEPSDAKVDADGGHLKCRTVLTFDSDQHATNFFEASNDIGDGYLELSLEEAMYLSYALGCLVVSRQAHTDRKKSKRRLTEKTMSIDQMWQEFMSMDPKFIVRYYVYHHYRSNGWVVKPGLKFGADYVLYPVGPPFYHAQYTVMIQCVWADTHEQDDSLSSREMSWVNFAATERLTSHVNKTPLICYVLRPRSLTFNRLTNIISLRSLKIEEIILSRWDPNAVNSEPDSAITID